MDTGFAEATRMMEVVDAALSSARSVSYTHLTLPTKA